MPSKGATLLRYLVAWIPALCALAVIIWESTDRFSSANTSLPLRHLWEGWLGPVSNQTWLLIHHHLRKAGHLAGYGLLSALLFRAWFLTINLPAKQIVLAWQVSTVTALVCTLLVGGADEIHQGFIPSRTSSPTDVAIDMAGAVTAQLLIAGFFLLRSLGRKTVPILTSVDC